MTMDFLTETLQARRDWDNIVKILKEKKAINQEYYAQQNFFRNKGEIKTFLNKEKLREFTTISPVL